MNKLANITNFEKLNEEKLYTWLTIIFWIPGAWTLWEFVYELSHMIGAIVCRDAAYAVYELLRMLPMTLCMICFLFSSAFLHNAYTARDLKTRSYNFKAMSFFDIIVAIIGIIYTVCGLITGRYISLVEGFPTILYPLDTILLSLLFIFFGLWAFKYSEYLRFKGSDLPYSECKFKPLLRNIGRVFCFLSFLVTTCAFAASVYGPFILDFRHGYIIFNILLWLNYFTAFFMFLCYRFIYCKKSNEDKPACLKKFSLSFLIINAVLMALYLITVQNCPEAPAQNAFGLFPVDFTASANVFHLIYGANNILVPLWGLIYGLKKK